MVRCELKKPLEELSGLDVGCGSGDYSFALEKYVKKVIGVEPYRPIYECALVNKGKLPLPAVNLYVRAVRKADLYDGCAYSRTYFGMRHFLINFFANMNLFFLRIRIPRLSAVMLGAMLIN